MKESSREILSKTPKTKSIKTPKKNIKKSSKKDPLYIN